MMADGTVALPVVSLFVQFLLEPVKLNHNNKDIFLYRWGQNVFLVHAICKGTIISQQNKLYILKIQCNLEWMKIGTFLFR